MSRWFRVYDDIINDPKVLKLPEETRWHWIALLCIASKNDGALPSTEDVAISLRVKTQAAAATIAALKAAGLLDLVDGRYVPHNWDGRQFKSDVSNERVKRYRERQRNVTETVTDGVTVTPHSVSDSVSVSVSEKEETREIAPFADPPDFDEFWEYWPNKVGKPAALKAYASAIKRRAKPSDIVDGVRNYIRDKPPDRPWLNPATFLNQNRWEDRPASIAKPLTAHQQKQAEGRGILDDISEFISGHGGQANSGVLRHDPGSQPEGVRGGFGGNLIELSPARSRTSG